MRRLLPLTLAVATLAQPAASAKEGVQAQLLVPPSAGATSGSLNSVPWSVNVPVRRDSRVALGAFGVFGCTTSATEALVRTFVYRYDDGRVNAAGRLWAPEPYFQWFSTGPPGARLGASAHDRSTLLSYFSSRVRAHEHLRITALHSGFDPHRNIVNFAGKLVRGATGLAGHPHDFKGAASCASGKPILIVWSM